MCAGGKRTRYDIHLDIAEAPIVRDASEYRRDILSLTSGFVKSKGKLAPRAAAGNVNKPILMIRKRPALPGGIRTAQAIFREISVRFDLVRDRLLIAEICRSASSFPAVVPAVVSSGCTLWEDPHGDDRAPPYCHAGYRGVIRPA